MEHVTHSRALEPDRLPSRASSETSPETPPETQSRRGFDELAHQIGELVHQWGFKRIHGRIWTCLALAKEPLDAADLVRRLKISKALVSISLRELGEYEVILNARRSSRGTQLYRTNPDLSGVLKNILHLREQSRLRSIAAAQVALRREFELAPVNSDIGGIDLEKLSSLEKMVAQTSTALEQLIFISPLLKPLTASLFHVLVPAAEVGSSPQPSSAETSPDQETDLATMALPRSNHHLNLAASGHSSGNLTGLPRSTLNGAV